MALAVPLGIVTALVGLTAVVGAVVGVLLAVGLVWFAVSRADVRVLDHLEAEPTDHARLSNLVEGLSLSIGLDEPETYAIDDPALNAAAVARGDATGLVLTTGLLDRLDRIQLESVVAELLVRIKNGDAEIATLAGSTMGLPMIDGPLAPVLRPLGTWGMSRVLDDDRDVLADRAAVAVTRYPPGLSSALTVIGESNHQPATATSGTAHAWIVPAPDGETVVAHSPLDWRIDVLLEI